MKILVGSRESRLAVVQSEMVIDCIKNNHPELEIELVTMKTTGDIILDRTLDKVGGKGLFVKELDAALSDGRADITVHSSKDLPMGENEKLPFVAFSKREDPRDVLVLPEGKSEIDFSLPIGCASKRREIQLKKLYPEATVKPVRGNVLTRLNKLDSGEYSALILASAGLTRLGLEGRISRYFEPEEMLPSAGQGIIAVQTRAGFDAFFLDNFRDENATICITAERAFVEKLDGGCSSPVAAHAIIKDGKLWLRGMDVDGNKSEITGEIKDAKLLGEKLGEMMLIGG